MMTDDDCQDISLEEEDKDGKLSKTIVMIMATTLLLLLLCVNAVISGCRCHNPCI